MTLEVTDPALIDLLEGWASTRPVPDGLKSVLLYAAKRIAELTEEQTMPVLVAEVLLQPLSYIGSEALRFFWDNRHIKSFNFREVPKLERIIFAELHPTYINLHDEEMVCLSDTGWNYCLRNFVKLSPSVTKPPLTSEEELKLIHAGILRPGMYAGERGDQPLAEWTAKAVQALLHPYQNTIG